MLKATHSFLLNSPCQLKMNRLEPRQQCGWKTYTYAVGEVYGDCTILGQYCV